MSRDPDRSRQLCELIAINADDRGRCDRALLRAAYVELLGDHPTGGGGDGRQGQLGQTATDLRRSGRIGGARSNAVKQGLKSHARGMRWSPNKTGGRGSSDGKYASSQLGADLASLERTGCIRRDLEHDAIVVLDWTTLRLLMRGTVA